MSGIALIDESKDKFFSAVFEPFFDAFSTNRLNFLTVDFAIADLLQASSNFLLHFLMKKSTAL